MNKEILRLAIPSMLANITIPLVGLVDVAIAGHISDASAIAGIAVATTLFDLLYWGFGFLRVGTGGMTAQAFGSNDHTKCAEIFIQSAAIAIAGALLIWAIQIPFLKLAMGFMHCDAATETFALQYFNIRVWAAPATLMLMTLKGWFIGMQDTLTTMVSDLIVNLTNMGLSYYFAVTMKLGASGVAWGTLAAQYIGLIVTLVILIAKHHRLFGLDGARSVSTRGRLRQALRWSALKHLFSLNANLFVRSLCFMVIYVGFTKLTTLYGTTEIALGAIVMKLFMIFSYMVDGFAYAGEALTGRFIGSSETSKLRQAVRLLFLWSTGLALLVSLLFGVWGTEIISLISTDRTIIEASGKLLIYLILMPIVSAAAFMWDGIFAGATAGREIRNCMIVAALAFLIIYIVCRPWASIHALYLAYFAHLLGRIVYLTIKYSKLICQK